MYIKSKIIYVTTSTMMKSRKALGHITRIAPKYVKHVIIPTFLTTIPVTTGLFLSAYQTIRIIP